MNKGADVQAVWDLFYNGVEAVHKGVKGQGDDFAFDEHLGYLSTCPTNVGTGMRASVHVSLPDFKTKQQLKDFVAQHGMNIDIRGTHGESTNTDGITIYDVSNKARLGSDCVEQIKTMVGGVKFLLEGKKNSYSNLDTSTWKCGGHCLIKDVLDEVDCSSQIENVTATGWDINKATLSAQKMKQHVGVYAGDAESYEKFSTVFDEVIKRYHGIVRADNHATPETYEKQVLPALPEGAIKSTRIRTARNLKGFPFTNNMSEEKRCEVESLLKGVFDGFENSHLKGTYYPMVGMSKEQRKELVDLHYLYINDDPCLEAIGTYDNWPQGRGIFINDNREKGVFIVWVGEEDQMRIMAMNKGADVQAVWDLFYNGVEEVHKGLKKKGHEFDFDEHLGYLSTCPTNVGTGMRASVHVSLPTFKTKADLKAYVATTGMAIDIRGTHGESTNTDGITIYDVSNKARLGSDCVQQIQTMVGGVKHLLEAKPVVKYDNVDTSAWKCGGHCLVKDVLDQVDCNSQMHEVTHTGWDINKATCTAQKMKQHVGVYAGDAESYEKFSIVFDEVIKRYHGIVRADNHATPETYEKQTLPALPEGAIKSTRIRTARNLKDFPYTCNMSAANRCEVEDILNKVFGGFTDPHLKGTYYPMIGMSEEQRKELVDLHYLYINDDPCLETLGTYDDWPQGRGIFINDNREKVVFIVWVGEEDQLRIMAMNKGADVQAVWDLFYSGLESVHSGVKTLGHEFDFDEHLGYLSSCPTNVGTGMRASVHVDLPKFKTKQQLKDFVATTGMKIDIRGTRGESTNTDGITIYDVSNKARLGSDCVEQINTMVNGVKVLLEDEPAK